MAAEITFENGRISNFKGLVTLTLDMVILHTLVLLSSTSTTCQISLKSKKVFVDGRTYARTHVGTHGRTNRRTFETGFMRLTLSKSRPRKWPHDPDHAHLGAVCHPKANNWIWTTYVRNLKTSFSCTRDMIKEPNVKAGVSKVTGVIGNVIIW